MLYQSEVKDYDKVSGILRNSHHELSVQAVLQGISPGEVYTDDPLNPKSVLIVTSECNLVSGESNHESFNAGVKEQLDYFDQITCDDENWEKKIAQIHCNIAIRKYVRRYYELHTLRFRDFANRLEDGFILEYVTTENLNTIPYENSDEIKEWIKFNNIDEFHDSCLGSYLRKGETIVSMSLVDCIVGDKAEIGVRTNKDYQGRGFGSIVAAATVKGCLSSGIKSIGWHCVDSNIGSITIAERVGFQLIDQYASFTPYPPIENDSDLSEEQWSEWASYYEKMNQIQPSYYWQAAVCHAKAHDMKKTIADILPLIETGQMWFTEYMPEVDAFLAFEGQRDWQELLERIK